MGYIDAVGISATVGGFGEVLYIVDIVKAQFPNLNGEDSTCFFRRLGSVSKVVDYEVKVNARLS